MDKYLVIEHHKFSTFKDDWTIKFASVDQDTALEKLVALNTLNDNKDKIYYIVDMKYLWTRDNEDSTRSDEPLVLTDEVKETKQGELPL